MLMNLANNFIINSIYINLNRKFSLLLENDKIIKK